MKMTDQEKFKLEQRGQMAYLREDITALSRNRDNLLRPLRERVWRVNQPDMLPSDPAAAFDAASAAGELAAVAEVEKTLNAALGEYNRLARALGMDELKRR